MEPGHPPATIYSPSGLISCLLALAAEGAHLPVGDAPLSVPQLRRLMYAILTEGYGA
jgi:hypothetical protein